MNKHHYCVIMAGGVGSRFWPMSRATHPKQFIDILGKGITLIQDTYQRLAPLVPKENVFIVTHESYKELIKLQLPDISEDNILCEPARKNTAFAWILATMTSAMVLADIPVLAAPLLL